MKPIVGLSCLIGSILGAFAPVGVMAENGGCMKGVSVKSKPDAIIDSLNCINEKASKSQFNKGMIAFFNLRSCPGGWESYIDGKGRYFVAIDEKGALGKMVGNALGDSEHRIVGKHTHDLRPSGDHDHQIGSAGAHSHNIKRTDSDGSGNFVKWTAMGSPHNKSYGAGIDEAPNHAHSLSASGEHEHAVLEAGQQNGTNAPYIQLLACIKK